MVAQRKAEQTTEARTSELSVNHVHWAGHTTKQVGNNVGMFTEYAGECSRPRLAPTCTAVSKAAFTLKYDRELWATELIFIKEEHSVPRLLDEEVNGKDQSYT